MSDIPFGFGRPQDPGEQPPGGGSGDSGGDNPFAMLGDPQQLAMMFQRMAQLMTWQGGPVNWEMARDTARQVVSAAGDASVLDSERAAVQEALRLADLWLGDQTPLASGITVTRAWSRAEWVEATMPVWAKLCEPIAAQAAESISGALSGMTSGQEGAVPGEMQALAPLLGMVKQLGGVMIAAQTGQAIGALAAEVVGSSDIGLPLAPEGTAALLPAGVTAFGSGLEVPVEEIRLFLALREAAHQRLFAHVPWLRAHLLGAVADYARGMTIDTSQLEETVRTLDISNPEALQDALAGGAVFQPEETPGQKAALVRLETTLALVEGWVATVVDAAATGRLPDAGALAEAVRRRRATGGPAERTFATLVGLELRPRKLREAAALWQAVGRERGIDGRDALWEHPDLLPTADDLEDPEGFAHGRTESDSFELDMSELTGEPAADDAGRSASDERGDEPGERTEGDEGPAPTR